MSVKKETQTNTDKILNSDIYDLTSFVDDIKKINIDGIDSSKETLLVGMYGYLGYEFTSILQNAIVVSSELANEAIPTRAKFDRNVITHALSLGVSKVAATAASMKVMLMFPEKALRNNMVDGKFILRCSTPINFDDYEFHTDYDIIVNMVDLTDSTNGTNKNYVYTARYDMENINPISDIDNSYLPPLAIYSDTTDNMVVLITTLHQVEYQEIDEKIVGSDDINNKTLSFAFESQMSHFSVEVTENGSDKVIELIPVYDGLYNQEVNKYCYYQYINSNTIRIRFDPNSYQPRTNANVKIKLWTSKGAGGNFDYIDDLLVRLTSDEYTNLYMIVKQRGEEGSTGGLDRKSVEELQKIIPKEALSRGSITTLTDLRNYFNSINNETSVLHVFRKEDNILTRIYYTYCLMKNSEGNVIPTNTIPVYIDGSDVDIYDGKLYLESGTPIYYYKYGDEASLFLLKNNYIGYKAQDVVFDKTEYSWDAEDYNFLSTSIGHYYNFDTNSTIYFKMDATEKDPYYNKWFQGTITNKTIGSYYVAGLKKYYEYYKISVRIYDSEHLFNPISYKEPYVTLVLYIPNSITEMDSLDCINPLGPNEYILTSLYSLEEYTYNNSNPLNNFNALQLSEGDNIRFCTYDNRGVWKLGEVLSIESKAERIIGLILLVHDESNNTFDSFTYRLPTLIDGDTSLGNRLLDTDIVSIQKITKFLYTSPLSIVLTDNGETDSHRINASYYLENINEERYLDFKCINTRSPLQFISSYVKVFRPSYLSTDRYNYDITIDLVPNIGQINDEMINRTRVVGVFYRDGAPACYSIADYIGGTNDDVMSYRIKLFTKPLQAKQNERNFDPNIPADTIDDDNRLYIGSSYLTETGYTIDDYKIYQPNGNVGNERVKFDTIYLDKNVTFRIYTFYKYNDDIEVLSYQDPLTNEYRSQDTANAGTSLRHIIPESTAFPDAVIDTEEYQSYKLSDMVLTNVYETHDGINLIYDYSNLMNSYVTMLQSESSIIGENTDGYIINRVPMIRYFYFNNESRINSFIKEMKRKILYVLDALDPLECTFGLDFKFFNTYGPSNMYHITNSDGEISDLINNVSLTMTFRTKFYNEDSDKETIIPLIKDDIKNYIEDLEDLDDIHFPNLTTEIESKYKEYVIYFEYVAFNIYDANYQHIITNENMEMLTVVPEFLNTDTDDYTGSPRININVIS